MFTPIYYMQSATGSFTFIYISKVFDNGGKHYRKITLQFSEQVEEFLILSPAKRLTTHDFCTTWEELTGP